MSTDDNKYKSPKNRKKPAVVKHVAVSPEARAAYETLVRERDERDRTYAKHLAPEKRDR